MALLDSIGAYIHEAFPLAGASDGRDSPARRGRKVLAVAAELCALAEFLRGTGRSAEGGEAADRDLAAVAAREGLALERIAAELEHAVAEAYSGSTTGTPEGERGS